MTIRYSDELINKAKAEGFTFNVRFLKKSEVFATMCDRILVNINDGDTMLLENTAYAYTPTIESGFYDFIVEDIILDGSTVKEIRVMLKTTEKYGMFCNQYPVYKVVA